MKNHFKLWLASVTLLTSHWAQAHAMLDVPTATAGAYYRASLVMTHGCAGSPTTAVRVLVPDGFRGAKPMPKPGWKLAVRSEPLRQPYVSDGRQITSHVVEITWTAVSADNWLPNSQTDEFVMRGSLPAEPGMLWFKVLQTCEKGQNDWSQIPADGKSTRGMETPAIGLEILPASLSEHQH
jgi:periplasmic copper chaperone A